jgi:hypothetical protein
LNERNENKKIRIINPLNALELWIHDFVSSRSCANDKRAFDGTGLMVEQDPMEG